MWRKAARGQLPTAPSPPPRSPCKGGRTRHLLGRGTPTPPRTAVMMHRLADDTRLQANQTRGIAVNSTTTAGEESILYSDLSFSGNLNRTVHVSFPVTTTRSTTFADDGMRGMKFAPRAGQLGFVANLLNYNAAGLHAEHHPGGLRFALRHSRCRRLPRAHGAALCALVEGRQQFDRLRFYGGGVRLRRLHSHPSKRKCGFVRPLRRAHARRQLRPAGGIHPRRCVSHSAPRRQGLLFGNGCRREVPQQRRPRAVCRGLQRGPGNAEPHGERLFPPRSPVPPC